MHDPYLFKMLATGTLIVATLFIGLFAREPWWRHPFGQSVMVLAAGIWLFALQTVLRQWFGPEYEHRQTVRAIAQGLILLAIAQRTWVLARLQWRDRNKR